LVTQIRRLAYCFVLIALLFAVSAPAGIGLANADVQAAQGTQDLANQHAVQQALNKLSPEEKVGQLFLVTFHGHQVDQKSQIYELITNAHIGGVMLRAANDNFTGPDQTAQGAYQLVSQLQTAAWDGAGSGANNTSSPQSAPADYLPLFVGVSQEGDGYPNDQLLDGVTDLPNLMAIGATWNVDLSNRVGAVLGQELSALGINLYFGPALDVLDQPYYSDSGQNLGTRSFGGDPYWVGEMGKAYIAGVHAGSTERIAVIAKNFPGRGSSDRLPEDEVATIRKSLEQLKQIEMPPFYGVTGNAPSPLATTDGLLVSHIRYQGLQDNLRRLTNPVSLDPQAFALLVNQPEFETWRKNGGIMVSDDLGSLAIRKVYDPSLKEFKASQVAIDAFLAGNDMLYVDNFTATGDQDAFTTITHTLALFAQRYRIDQAFAQHVDESVSRILALKMKLYPTMDFASVLPPQSGISSIGGPNSNQVSYDVASQAVTLISPSQTELDSSNLPKPQRNDRYVFLTDTQSFKQCTQCPDQDALGTKDLQNSIMKLYGPASSGQFSAGSASSYSFTDLLQFLNGQATPNSPNTNNLEDDLRSANWIVVSTLSLDPNRPASAAFRRLLSERPDLLLKNQHIILFAFNAPFYLDATDISKLTAYYGLYGKSQAFLDTAAKVLFREITPPGALPVTVLGAGYDLIHVTSPDPSQVIPLYLDVDNGIPTDLNATPPATPPATPTPALYKVGDTIPLKTGEIYDYNHHIVPNGTVVRFIFTRNADSSTTQQIEAVTSQGIAHASYKIDNTGLLEIRVTSEEAQGSILLHINVSKTEASGVTAVPPPTQTPSNTPVPSPTPTATITPTATPAPVITVRPEFSDWLLAMLTLTFATALAYFAGTWWATLRWAVRWGLCAMLGGLAAYLYLAANLPGTSTWLLNSGRPAGVIGVTLLGAIIGCAAGLVWRAWLEQRSVQHMPR
jgi:beta-N-acetylhexosaminidase